MVVLLSHDQVMKPGQSRPNFDSRRNASNLSFSPSRAFRTQAWQGREILGMLLVDEAAALLWTKLHTSNFHGAR